MRTFDLARVQQHVQDGWLTACRHPTADLTLYNYSPYCQYEGVWDDITTQCRGLILDSRGVAHSAVFPKFHNHTETGRVQIPAGEGFWAFEKMDGSFVETYWVGDEVFLCTKGSFTYEKYVGRATAILDAKYPHLKARFKKGVTYIFEVIFPEGRIVVDYGRREDLVLTAVFDIATGAELDLDAENPGFPTPARTFYPAGTDVQALVDAEMPNAEGFVFKFVPSGLRMKGKYAKYVHLHHIITEITTYDIWEGIRDYGGIAEATLALVPDEFYDWVRRKEAEIRAVIAGRQQMAEQTLADIAARCGVAVTPGEGLAQERRAERKVLAQEISRLPGLLRGDVFNALLGRHVSEQLLFWQSVKPAYERPFDLTNEEEVNDPLADASRERPANPEMVAQ